MTKAACRLCGVDTPVLALTREGWCIRCRRQFDANSGAHIALLDNHHHEQHGEDDPPCPECGAGRPADPKAELREIGEDL